MKRIGNLYEKLISDENLKLALFEVNKSHRWYPRHRPNRTVMWIESDIDARVADLRRIIEEGFVPGEVVTRKKWDKSAEKWRDINEPALYPDQYIHHALIQVLEPAMMRGMDKFCCGSIRGRGIHYGMNYIKKWMKRDPEGTKYCMEIDIHHFYENLKPEIVMTRLKQLIKDTKVLDLAERVMSQGVLIGVYSSQWFANVTLQPLDHLIRECDCKAKHYLRYMDNFTVFSDSKETLHQLLIVIGKWLNNKGMSIKSNWQIFPTKDRLPTGLGYRYGHGYTLLKKRNLMRLRQQLNKYYKLREQGKRISNHLASSLISRLGQLKHCNNVGVYKRIYRGRVLRELKQVVRDYIRKERLLWNTSSAMIQPV